MAYEKIDIAEAREMMAREAVTVIDIRDLASYQSGHIEQALHVHNDNLEQFLREADRDLPIIVCCYRGYSSRSAADYFNTQGFARAYSLNGGYAKWAADGR